MSALTSSSRREERGISAALVEVCRRGAVTPCASPRARQEFVDAARFHRIAPLVHFAYRRTAPDISDALQADRQRAIAMHLQACGALQQLSAVLFDLEWLTFKGPVFSELAHPKPGLRTYHDVDVLVAHSSLREVSSRLLAAGWQVADYRDMLRNRDLPGEMHWLSPGGVLMDLHWSMVNMASRRRLFEVPTADLLRRRASVDVGSRQVWTLDPTDSLVHACLHAALSGANKLLYLIDVDRLSRNITDWDEVATRAQDWQVQTQVALVLGRAQRVLGTPLPIGVKAQGGVSAPLRGFLALTDRVAPVQSARRNSGLAKFVARAVRPTASATALAAGRNAALGLKERALGPRERTSERLSADEASLEVYLTAVESSAGGRGAA